MSRKIAAVGTGYLLGLSALLSVPGVVAQPAHGLAPASSPQPNGPELSYVSPISTYKAYEPQTIQPWKEANDNVGRIGGWRAYARETSPNPTTSPSVSTTSGEHTLHHQVENK